MRPIDADSLEKVVEEKPYDVVSVDRGGFSAAVVFSMIADMPTVDPVKHGHWIEDYDSHMYMDSCSACNGRSIFGGRIYRFCPNCGAKMDEVSDDAAD